MIYAFVMSVTKMSGLLTATVITQCEMTQSL